jgi:hypothetical protein
MLGLRKRLQWGLCLFMMVVTVMSVMPMGEISFLPKKAAAASTVELNKRSLILGEGRTFQLELKGSTKSANWKTSAATIATVTKSGVVKGVKAGKVIITATVGKENYSCKVTVAKADTQEVQTFEHTEMFEGSDKDLISWYYAWDERALISLDLKPSQDIFSKYGFQKTDIYAAFYSETTITIEGFDAKGKSVGSITKKGSFYHEFPKAVELLISNVKPGLAIFFYPVAPTIISKAGTYYYDDFTWYDLPGGNQRAYYLYSYKNSFWNFKQSTSAIHHVYNYGMDLASYRNANTSPTPIGITDFWVCGYYSSMSPDVVPEIKDFILIAGESHIYYDDKTFFLFGKEGLQGTEDYAKEVKKMMGAMRSVGDHIYINDTDVFSLRLNISCFDTHPSSAYPNLFLNDTVMDLNDLENYRTHLHEMAHYYDTAHYHYGILINAWVEGFAETYSEDALLKLNKIDQPYLHQDYDFADYKQSGAKSFEDYFVSLDTAAGDEYSVGYHFIRYIQDMYGKAVVAKINASINEKIEKPSDTHQDEARNKSFIQIVKSYTSKSVFIDFEKKVINKK